MAKAFFRTGFSSGAVFLNRFPNSQAATIAIVFPESLNEEQYLLQENKAIASHQSVARYCVERG
jgi:hypothetical protein